MEAQPSVQHLHLICRMNSAHPALDINNNLDLSASSDLESGRNIRVVSGPPAAAIQDTHSVVEQTPTVEEQMEKL